MVYFCCFVEAHEACGPLEIDSALNAVQSLKNELQDAKMAALDGQLKPLPGESVCQILLLYYVQHITKGEIQTLVSVARKVCPGSWEYI